MKGHLQISPQEALDTLTVVPLIAGRPNAADILGCSEKTARRRAESGQIPTLKIGRRVMVSTDVLRKMLAGE